MYDYVVRGSLTAAYGSIQVMDVTWPRGYSETWFDEAHRIGLSLSPMPGRSRGRFDATGRPHGAVGRVMFLPASIPVEVWNDGGFQRLVGCQFNDEAFRDLAGEKADWGENELARCFDVRSRRLIPILHRMAEEAMAPEFGGVAVFEALAEVVLVDLIRTLKGDLRSEAGHQTGGLTPLKLATVEDRVRATEIRLPSVAELADLVHLSSRHLLRAYTKTMGETLRDRLQREASARAKELLRSTTLPIKVIAHRLGFASQASFSAAFRKATGDAPRIYRNRSSAPGRAAFPSQISKIDVQPRRQ